MIDNNDVLDAREAANYLKINEQTVRRLAREKDIPAFKVGGSWRFKKSSLDRWAQSQEMSHRRQGIMVVDDDEAVLEIIRRTLERAGYLVTTAHSGDRALELFQENGIPDLVFLDLKMPGLDGPTVLKEMRARSSSLPVVILTGYPESELMSRALQYGPITLLSKPVSPDKVVETVRNTLRTEPAQV